jgi:hypothetical protein
MTDTDLDLLPTMQLLDAVCRRFEAAIILGVRWPGVDVEKVETIYKFKGGAIMALGLTEMMKINIAHTLDPQHREVDEL